MCPWLLIGLNSLKEPLVTNLEQLIEDEEFHGKLKVGEKIFSKTFGFGNLKYLELFTGYSKYDFLGLEILLKTCLQLETLVLVYFYELLWHDGGLHKSKEVRSIFLQLPRLKFRPDEEVRGNRK